MTESVRTTGRSETAGEDLLLDRYLPRFDVTLVEHVVADGNTSALAFGCPAFACSALQRPKSA